MPDPTILAIPLFGLSMAIEAWVLHRARHGYELADTATSLSGGVGNLVVKGLTRGLWLAVFSVLYEHRVANLGVGIGGAIALLFAEDFCFYWYHRVSHVVRLFWANHVVHHSSERYTLATALRQSWTAPILGLPFWMPLPLLGFRPEHVALMGAISLLYQYGLHTETITRLGPIEWVMNTPSHHRAHHGSNPQYLDINYGGIFIIWDRLFGTFVPEVEKPVYGITKPVRSYNPFYVQLHEFMDIARDVARARSLREALHQVFRSPSEVQPAVVTEAASASVLS